MWLENSVSYGKEPFNLRLTLLRMIRNLHIIIGFTVLGTLVFGGGYYVKNVLLNRNAAYAVTSTYKVSFVSEPNEPGEYYINEMTWNTYVHSKEFLDVVWDHLEENAVDYDAVFVESAEELATMIEAKLASDVHVPSTVVTTESASWTILVAEAVEQTMVQEFVESNEHVASISVIDPGIEAEEVVPDVRPVRAFVLSAVLSLFFVVVILLLKDLGDDSIWLPATLRRRYGLATVGTVNSSEVNVNLEYLFSDRNRVAVCAIDAEVNPMEVVNALQVKNAKKWIPIPAPMLCPEACAMMRETDEVLLVVKAGSHAGKSLEYVLEFLQTQEIKITGALLWDADEWLIRAYYGKV